MAVRAASPVFVRCRSRFCDRVATGLVPERESLLPCRSVALERANACNKSSLDPDRGRAHGGARSHLGRDAMDRLAVGLPAAARPALGAHRRNFAVSAPGFLCLVV